MAHDVRKAMSREAEGSAREHKRLEYSHSNLERVAVAIGMLYLPAHVQVEDAPTKAFAIPVEAKNVGGSLDRVGVPT